MKLVEIKDVRVGQIRKVTAFNQWKDGEEFEVLAVIEASDQRRSQKECCC